ncbi:hypothetical protein [Roseivirga misakiensis]|uniref:Glycosyltransferase RgtA/B/C/D-like domain-containing protein n=1 Tax=Roseivirga misakiensis TaxID=1563681 RepID=A0A1E5SKI3_9BACT|nr:hypothetical protein [Roseivirga misakiensis]OEJ99638.1 hypothetical protein BFP71_08685 [Roseivirga misakiensis]
MRIKRHWLYIFLTVALISFFGYQDVQEPLSYEFAPQFDGNDYEQLYLLLGNSDTAKDVIAPHPFSQRILVPLIASLLNTGSIIKDFQYVNLLFTLLSVWVIFELWRHLGFELKWFLAGFTWLLFHWTGIIRLNAFDPITVDVPLYCFQALFLLLVVKRNFVHLIWLAPLATIQKESFIALMCILLVYGLWHNKKTDEGFYKIPFIVAGLVLALLANYLVNAQFTPTESTRNALQMLAYQAKEAILNPFEMVRWLAALSMAFGPALFLTLRQYGATYRYDNTRNLLLIFSLTYFAFGILAGGDMTRIIYLGFPFIATWILFELKDLKTNQVLLIGLLSLPLMVIYKTIPDPAFYWDLWQSWYPEFAEKSMVLIVLGYVLLVWFILEKSFNPKPSA